MAVAPGTYNISLQRRADYSVALQFKDSTGTAINLTGWTVAAQTWNQDRTTKYADFTVTYTNRSTGTYSETGNAAGLQATRKTTAAPGAFTLTGNAAAFGLARKVSASPGNFALVGNNATLGNTYAIQCSPSAFAVIGADARLFKTRRRLINF